MNEGLEMGNSDNQKFCLKWNNFQNNFMSQFEALKEDEDFVDVTLSCYGHSIRAHKVVLSACSPYLKTILKEHPCKHPVIILDNLSFSDLEALIQFVYTGQVYVEQTELSSFLKAAETLQIRGLTETSTDNNLTRDSNVPTCQKREHDDGSDVKRVPNKKVAKKVFYGGYKEVREAETREKDWNRTAFIKVEESGAASSQSMYSEFDQPFIKENHENHENYESYERSYPISPGDEEYSGDLKRPHWLDPRACTLCNRVYSNLSNLRQHMKLIHNPTLVTCKICFKTFKTDLYLRRHLISYHELNVSGNNFSPIDPSKPVQNQPGPWNLNIKSERFDEMFSGDEPYQVPD